MESSEVLDISREAVFVLIKIAAPAMFTALCVGLVISLVQALTQIQEATLSFVPKLLAIFACLIIFMPFMISTLKVFTEHLSERIIYIQ